MAKTDAELANAIDEAAAEIAGEENQNEEVESGEETEETGEENQDEDEETRLKAEEQETKEAKILYQALKDPKSQKAVLFALMGEAGISLPGKGEEPTKKEIQETKKATLDIVKEALGSEYHFLAEKMSKLLDTVLAQEREERSSLKAEIDTDKIISETNTAEAKLNAETKGDFKKFESEIAKLVDKYPPGPSITVEEYLRGLYLIASAGKTVGKTKADLANKINRNANDAAGRLTSTGRTSAGTDNSLPVFKGKGALGKSVDYALKQLEAANKGKGK